MIKTAQQQLSPEEFNLGHSVTKRINYADLLNKLKELTGPTRTNSQLRRLQEMKKASEAYIQGFEDYCKQAGVNAEELIKQAQVNMLPGTTPNPMDAARKWQAEGRPSMLDNPRQQNAISQGLNLNAATKATPPDNFMDTPGWRNTINQAAWNMQEMRPGYNNVNEWKQLGRPIMPAGQQKQDMLSNLKARQSALPPVS
ncbi:hypothetical protein ACFLQL_00165 [Verrucomicrobiota bacterium]